MVCKILKSTGSILGIFMQARTLTGMWGHRSEGRPPSSCSRLLPTSPQSSSSHRQCRNKKGEATALRYLNLHSCIVVFWIVVYFHDMQVILEEARTQRRPKSAPQPQSRKMASVEERLKVDSFVCLMLSCVCLGRSLTLMLQDDDGNSLLLFDVDDSMISGDQAPRQFTI